MTDQIQPQQSGEDSRQSEFVDFLKLRSGMLRRCLQIVDDPASKASALAVAMNFLREAGRYFPNQLPAAVPTDQLPFPVEQATAEPPQATKGAAAQAFDVAGLPFRVPKGEDAAPFLND